MKKVAFINYRRSDSPQAAQGLYAQMRMRFGGSHVFMDVNTIQPGTTWPDRIRLALDEASVILSMIGPRWLTAADQYGRRRLDQATDWVRLEIVHALEAQKPIFPTSVTGTEAPPLEGPPPKLRRLLR